ncbi:MAG: SDR family oxidoreductase, partial [Myxococcales bacterium]|nr:SDR family oxidoreductase [Myxococcales bacterium]
YNVSKAAVVALTETLAAELGPAGTTCTVLAPLFFQTNLMATSRVTDERLKKKAAALMAEGKLSADDVAEAALKAVARGDLYALPMRDGRWYWRLKRLSPQTYVRLLDWMARRKLKG